MINTKEESELNKLKARINKLQLFTEIKNGKIRGYSNNIRSWPVFYIWINKSNKLTVKTRGVQKSFEKYNSKDELKNILEGFQII